MNQENHDDRVDAEIQIRQGVLSAMSQVGEDLRDVSQTSRPKTEPAGLPKGWPAGEKRPGELFRRGMEALTEPSDLRRMRVKAGYLSRMSLGAGTGNSR